MIRCGVVWSDMIAGIAEILGDKRSYHLCDSFEGLPAANAIDGKAALAWQQNAESEFYFDNCTADESFARKAMKLSKVDFKLNKGWFSDTLPVFKFKTALPCYVWMATGTIQQWIAYDIYILRCAKTA